MSLVELQGVNKSFGDLHVLVDIDLNVDRGEVVVVIGPSGSGKSTLCRCINRLERIDSGEIRIEGVRLPEEGKDLARLRADVGMVFQSFNLFPHLSAVDNVALGPNKTLKLARAEARSRAMGLLERVGIADKAKRYPAELSGGQQQRVAIARSLINRPRLLFADEPTGNLDSTTSAEVLEMFQRLNAEEGITIILVTHDPGVAEHAKRVIRMRDGRIEDADVNRQAVHAAAQAIESAGTGSGIIRRAEVGGVK